MLFGSMQKREAFKGMAERVSQIERLTQAFFQRVGLNNILRKNRPDLTDSSQYLFTQSVDRATFNMVSLCFYFE